MSLHNSLLSTFCALLCATSVLQAQNGALDLSFNGTGYVITSTGITDEVQEILVQDDQKILAVGWGYYPGLNTESGSVFPLFAGWYAGPFVRDRWKVRLRIRL
jgi:hypothetical protein